jgi:hypothetical protein
MKKVSFNPKRDIPYLAMVIQACIFSYSGSLLLGWIGWIIGALMGILVSVSVLYASSQYAAKERKPWIIAGLAVMMLFSPIINGTALYFELSPKMWDIWRGVVSVAWGVLPDVAGAVAGFVAGKGMIKQDEQPKEVAAQPKTTPKKKTTAKHNRIDRVRLVGMLRTNPAATNQELATPFGVSAEAVRKLRKDITPAELGLTARHREPDGPG